VTLPKRSLPQSWNKYAYVLNNPLHYIDLDGQEEREGILAGVIVNNSSEVIWVASDVGDETIVIPLNPGETSATYFQDADAVVIDPGTVTSQGAVLAPSIAGETSGAIKIGASVVGVEDAGPLNLGLNRSSGYGVSWLLGKAGAVDAKEAQKQGWVIPKDRGAAEKRKDELRKMVEEREKKRREEEERKKHHTSKSNKRV
jgi:hypothetical protein